MSGGLRLHARPYQRECHDAVFSAWGIKPWANGNEPVRSTIANLATGSGKTIIASMIAHTVVRELGERLLFVADSNELCAQPVHKMSKTIGIFPAMEKAEFRASMHADVVVASAQTLAHRRRLERFPRDHFKFVIGDECHRSPDRFAKIRSHFEGAKVMGLTATAFRRNLKDLSKWYESVCYELGSFGPGGLIEQGYLTPVEVMTLDINADISQVEKDATGDYDAEQLGNVMAPVMRAVAREIRDNPALRERHILAFLPLIRSSEDFVRICREEGVTAEHVDGGSRNRAELIQGFEDGRFQVLSNSQVMSTGVDFIRCDALLNLAPTTSAGLYRQRVGRIMRVLPGLVDHLPTAEERRAAIAASAKPNAIIVDLLFQFGKLGLADPASLVVDDQTELKQMRDAIRKKRSPEELEQIRRQIQAEREQKVLEEWERTKGLKKERISAEVLAARLHIDALRSYSPFSEREAGTPTKGQRWALEARGIDADTVRCKGQADLIIQTLDNAAPPHCWEQLRARGHAHPERMNLDDAIRVLRDEFPMQDGQYRGRPFREVPFEYWEARYNEYMARRSWIDRYPAEKRYMKHLIEGHRRALRKLSD